jgi:hypothetical protein
MTQYECKICSFITNHRTNYKKHLLTDKHNRKEREIEKIQEKKNIETICKYCDKNFSCKQSMYYHIKYNCKKNNDEDIKELVRLLNKERNERKEDKEQILNLQKQIDKLSGKLEININTTNIQNNFILSYDKTDTSHLTDKDFESAIEKVNNSIKYLIEKIHFNPEKPENMNIYIPNLKNKYLMLFENGEWQTKNRKDELDHLKTQKEDLINEWFEKNKVQYPKLKSKFQRYIENTDETKEGNSIEYINEQLELLLYNKKNLIKNILTN